MCTDGEGIGQPIKVSECDRTTAPGLTGVGIAVSGLPLYADWLLQHQALTIANLSFVIGWYIVYACVWYTVYIYIHTTFIKYINIYTYLLFYLICIMHTIFLCISM